MPIASGKVCCSCGKLSDRYVEFKCPKCGETDMVRCLHCREVYAKYTCKSCKFEGP